MDTILILDFGSQTTGLIARRIRETGVYTEIIHGDSAVPDQLLKDAKGIILSGSPHSVYEADAPKPDPKVYSAGIPVLGICYGFQRMTQDNGGKVSAFERKEYGKAPVNIVMESPLFAGIPDGFASWMSHGDSVDINGRDFVTVAESENHIACSAVPDKQFYGIQFHPEVSHCEYGTQILRNFVCDICGARLEWNMDQYLEYSIQNVRERVGTTPVLLLISGGVDSTVVGGLLLKALPSEQVYLMYIDTGMMRKGETDEVRKSLTSLGARNLAIIDASEQFLTALDGVDDPEKKREIIGDLFIKIQQTEIQKIFTEEYFLAQGTLYTDMIESGKGVGNKAKVIKSHHNVRSPLVESLRDKGRIIEPLAMLYKDEVRELGTKLSVLPHILARHPFPGPGLAVRILGAVDKRRCDILREADAIFIDELKKRNLYDEIWQAFCVLLPVRSVGVTGDAREYGYVTALRAIISRDGMTADVYPFEMKDLLEISAAITNQVSLIGRVVYDISSKPPATIEWE